MFGLRAQRGRCHPTQPQTVRVPNDAPMRLILDQSEDVAAWVAARIPQMAGAADFGPATAIGVASEDGRALGGVVFHGYQPRFRNIEVSFASETPRWLTRNLIRQILAYPFDQLACQRLTAITPKKARAARAFLERFGFKREGVVRRGFGDDDAIVSGLLKGEWERSRWQDRASLSCRQER
jgi:RimJ/RimL family protein N-acetyltransferase